MSELLVQPPSVETIYGLDEISDTVQPTPVPLCTSSVACHLVGPQNFAGTLNPSLSLIEV